MATDLAQVEFGDDDGGDASLLADFLVAMSRAAARRDPFVSRIVSELVDEAAHELAARGEFD